MRQPIMIKSENIYKCPDAYFVNTTLAAKELNYPLIPFFQTIYDLLMAGF